MTKDPKKTDDKPETVALNSIKPAKVEEAEEKIGFDISPEDLASYKKWQKEQETAKETTVSVGTVTDDKVYAMWKEESRLVKGIFRCREPEGGSITFYFRKYKWDTTTEYTMVDGEVYEVPLAVARHLNANCNYPVHSHILGADGNPTIDRHRVKSRMNFEGMEFAVA